MQSKLGIAFSLKYLLSPKNNQWFKRTCLVFAFILFDYFSTIAFCRTPYEEANLFARAFMESYGIPLGLTLFVFVANLPIYMALNLDSHLVKFPPKLTRIVETFIDVIFAWFIAGLHFSGGTSWFWYAPNMVRQVLGTVTYLATAFLLIKPHELKQSNQTR